MHQEYYHDQFAIVPLGIYREGIGGFVRLVFFVLLLSQWQSDQVQEVRSLDSRHVIDHRVLAR